MKKTITYSSIIIATLLIGFIIGFLVNGRVTRHKIRNMRSEFTDQGFNRLFMRVLHPTLEQMEQLKPILRKHAENHRGIMKSFHSEQEALFQDFRSDIQPYLTEEQIQRLDEMHEKHKRRLERDGPRGRRPHPRPGK